MKIALCLFLALLLCAFQVADTAREQALESLTKAEHAFAAASVNKGIKAAFIDFLADDGLVFMPGPVNGKVAYGKMPESNMQLFWYPAYADISASKDWGYTTGPYELRTDSAAEKPVGAGFYLSVWKKQPGGQWKVAIDMGNSFSPALLKQEVYQAAPAVASKTGAAKEALLARDVQQVQPYHNQTLIYRHGQYPYKYKDTSIEPASNVVYTHLGYEMSPAADMAYTYGSYSQPTGKGEEVGYYLKVWKTLDNEWKLVAHNLVPAQK